MPIMYNDIDQGSPEWFLIRQGIPTASKFQCILTGPTRQFKAGAISYMNEKIAEMITGMDQGSDYISDEMELGTITEQAAADSYEFINGVDTHKVGFVTDDEGHFGCSPDRFVGHDGIVEIKRKKASGMVKYLLEKKIDPAHIAQIQGNLAITGRKWCDWHLYNPDTPRLTIRTYRNEKYIADLIMDLKMWRKLMFKRLGQLAADDYIDLQEMAKRAVEARANIHGVKIDFDGQIIDEGTILDAG